MLRAGGTMPLPNKNAHPLDGRGRSVAQICMTSPPPLIILYITSSYHNIMTNVHDNAMGLNQFGRCQFWPTPLPHRPYRSSSSRAHGLFSISNIYPEPYIRLYEIIILRCCRLHSCSRTQTYLIAFKRMSFDRQCPLEYTRAGCTTGDPSRTVYMVGLFEIGAQSSELCKMWTKP